MTAPVTTPAWLQQDLLHQLPEAVRGEGIRIWDSEGREYIDACSGAISVISIGHGVREVADAIEAAGVCIEVSSAGLHKPVGELYPDPAMLAGHPPITLASDAHVPQNVGRDFAQALALARAAGYEMVTVFDRRTAQQQQLG